MLKLSYVYIIDFSIPLSFQQYTLPVHFNLSIKGIECTRKQDTLLS